MSATDTPDKVSKNQCSEGIRLFAYLKTNCPTYSWACLDANIPITLNPFDIVCANPSYPTFHYSSGFAQHAQVGHTKTSG